MFVSVWLVSVFGKLVCVLALFLGMTRARFMGVLVAMLVLVRMFHIAVGMLVRVVVFVFVFVGMVVGHKFSSVSTIPHAGAPGF